MDEEPVQPTIEVKVKTKWESFISEFKTFLWTSFWTALVFFVDALSQFVTGTSMPDITTNLFGLFPNEVTINTAIPAAFIVNRFSKWLHDYRQGKIS